MSSVVYDLTVTQGINVVHTVMGAENGTEITGILDPGSYYNISVSARTVNGSCGGEPTTIEYMTPHILLTTQVSLSETSTKEITRCVSTQVLS